MNSTSVAIVAFTFATLSQITMAQNDIPLVPLGIPADKFDFTGTWNYSTGSHQVSGQCPNGEPMAGTMEITHAGAEVGLMLSSGATCNPGSMCMFDGAVGESGQLVVSNADTVDDEGGSAANAMWIFFVSEEMGAGFVASGYVHPDGFECQWSHSFRMWR